MKNSTFIITIIIIAAIIGAWLYLSKLRDSKATTLFTYNFNV